MATAFIGSEQNGVGSDVAVAPVAIPVRPLRTIVARLIGVTMLAVSGYITLAMFTGLSTARGLISDYEALHGPLQIENGYWAHGNTPGSFALCDQIDAAAGWLYPFGILAWFPVLVLLWFGSAMTFDRVRTIEVVVPILTVFIVALGFYFGGTTGDVLAILE